MSYDGGSNTVDVVIRSLRRKLGAVADRIETVRGVGYRLSGEATALVAEGCRALIARSTSTSGGAVDLGTGNQRPDERLPRSPNAEHDPTDLCRPAIAVRRRQRRVLDDGSRANAWHATDTLTRRSERGRHRRRVSQNARLLRPCDLPSNAGYVSRCFSRSAAVSRYRTPGIR